MGCGTSKTEPVVEPLLHSEQETELSTGKLEKEQLENHSVVLAKTLNMLRKKGALCDLNFSILDDEERPIKVQAHKSVLVGASGYFRDILGASDLHFDEEIADTSRSIAKVASGTGRRVFEFPFAFSPKILEIALEHCYLGTVNVDVDTVEPVIDAAVKLAMPALQRDCIKVLKAKYTPDKLDELYRLSQKLNSLDLRRFVLDKAMENFDRFVSSELFQDLTHVEMEEFIKHRMVTSMRPIPSELRHFYAIIEWYDQDPVRRDNLTKDLLSNLLYDQMSSSDLSTVVLRNEVVAEDPKLREFVESVAQLNRKSCVSEKPDLLDKPGIPLKTITQKSRGTETYRSFSPTSIPTLLAIGGIYKDQRTSKIERLNEHKWGWSDWGYIPSPTSHHCVAVVNKTLYVVGGELVTLGGTKRSDTVWRFSQAESKWFRLPSMHQARSRFYLGVWKKFLIAVGGLGEKSVHASVEKYNFNTKKWEFSQFLPQERFNHAGCEMKDSIYVTGGEVNHSSSNQLLRLSSDSTRWQKLTPMKCARSNHCMAAARNKFFVFGGENVTMEISHPVTSAIECYCNANNMWHRVERKIDFYGLVDCSCVTLKGRICFLGGRHNNMNDYRKHVTTYDPVSDMWSSLPNLPRRTCGTACAVMKIDITQGYPCDVMDLSDVTKTP